MLVVGVATGATIVACGGNSTPKKVDAKVFLDGKVFLDSSGGGGLMGLGQKCGSGLAACPTNAADCIGAQGTTSWCTPICDMNATGKTGSDGRFPASGSGSITPAPSDSACSAVFTGTVGTPACAAILASTPAYTGQLNTAFTGIQMDCFVLCGTGSGTGPCPTGMTCATTGNFAGICFPS
jgi:hypothetical protein